MAATASAIKTREAVRDAADALLRDGVRPSVNAIRARLGRGSDTTIASALNDWWKTLGQRVTDLESRPDVPEAVWTAADALWTAALDAAQQALAADRKTLATDREKVAAQVEAALHRQAQAEHETEKLEKALAGVRQALRQADTARASEAARAEALSAQRDELQARLAKVEKAATDRGEQFERRQVQAAERFDRAEARVLAQLDAAKGEAKQLKAELSEQGKQMRAAAASANQAINTIRQEAVDLRQQLEVKAALLHEREHDCAALRAQAEAQGGELASIKTQLDHARRELTASRDECRKLAGAAQKDASCIQRLREQVVELETRLDMGGRGVKPRKPRGKKTNQSN